MVFERADRVPDDRGAHPRHADPALGLRVLEADRRGLRAARRTTSTASRYTICRPFNAYGPGEMPEDEPGIAHVVPDLIKKCLALARRAAADLRRRHPDADAHPHRRHRRRRRHRDVAPGRPARGLQHLRRRGADRGRDRAHHLGGLRRDPEAFELEHLPSFPVDVVRRWPSVEKAERLLGWEARIDVREGIGQTVAWLRTVVPAAS